MIKKIFILFFFVTACGYEPIYVNKNEVFFKKITLVGDKQINRKIISSLSIKEKPQNLKDNQIILESSKIINTTSKDERGQPKTFRTNVMVKLIILENGIKLKEKIFSENFSYQNRDNKYDLFSYQDDVQNNLVNKIIDNLTIFINL
tara:strand:+ start:373 stop:813 length:441 start_codon:yes stop_codon:yes gene_type:complete